MSGSGALLHAYRPRSLPIVAKVTIGLLVLLGIVALPSGWILMTPAPGEIPMGMPLEWLEGSPFSSYFIPGLLLFGVFGVGSLVAAGVGALRHAAGPYLAFAIGAGHVIWISAQLVMVSGPGIFILQPALFVYGTLIAALSYLWWRRARLHL